MDRDGVPGRTDRDQAVVLTLRKRYSAVRRDARDLLNKSQGGIRNMWGSPRRTSTEASGAGRRPVSADNVSSLSNPWQDRERDADSDLEGRSTSARPTVRHSQSQPQPLHHRLSFDHATGVITLPEDGEWLLQDEYSDSEEGGTSQESPAATPEAEGAEGADGTVPKVVDLTSAVSGGGGGARHRTYYHHPERRRQTLPGAFPPSSPQV